MIKSGCFLTTCSSNEYFDLNVALQWMQMLCLKSEATSGCFNKCLSKRFFVTVLKLHF
ncbi:unnamed protein product, partial [Callosobruchus maculatus]